MSGGGPTAPVVFRTGGDEQDTTLARRTETAGPNEMTALLQMALEKNVPMETLERLVALKERVDTRAAKQEFNHALAAFQAECPAIRRDSTASIATASGGSYSYSFAELNRIADVIRPLLDAHGFSYSWDSKYEGGMMIVVCTLSHVAGHEKTATFPCPTESKSGMNAQQKQGAALSYAKRQSLVQVLGITTADPDTDGKQFEPITAAQIEELKGLAKERDANEKKFLEYIGAESWEKIPKANFKMARTALMHKRKQS